MKEDFTSPPLVGDWEVVFARSGTNGEDNDGHPGPYAYVINRSQSLYLFLRLNVPRQRVVEALLVFAEMVEAGLLDNLMRELPPDDGEDVEDFGAF